MIGTMDFQYTFEEFREGAAAMETSAQKHQKSHRSWSAGSIVFLVIVIGFFALRLWLRDTARRVQVQSTADFDWTDLFLGLEPWFLILVLVYFFIFRQNRRRYERVFETEPIFHEPRSVQVAESGLTFVDRHSRTTIDWPGFIRFVETQNLFLLFVTEAVAHSIPKRAFANLEDVGSARELFLKNVAPPTSGFPILPRAGDQPS